MRYLLRHPPDPRPSLVVQTCPKTDDSILLEFRRLLYGMGCSSGLLFDPSACLVVHDSFSSLGPDSLAVTDKVPTADVLSKLQRPGYPKPPNLDRLVKLWLEMLAVGGQDALPDEDTVATALITDVLPAAVGAVVSEATPPDLSEA